MARSGTPKKPTRLIDHVAIAVTGLILLGFILGFERFLTGSWRVPAAGLLAVAVCFGGAFAVDAGLRRVGWLAPEAPAPAWLLPALPALGAIAGAAYSLVAAGHLGRPVVFGAVAGGVVAVLNLLGRRRQRGISQAPPAA